MMLIILFLWLCIGYFGYIFWESREHDMYISDMLLGIAPAIMGPFAWVVGLVIYFPHDGGHVIIKRRIK